MDEYRYGFTVTSFPFNFITCKNKKLLPRFNIDSASPIESVKSAKVPIIFIHGESDTFVPCNMSKKLYDACSNRKHLTIVKNAEHGISYLFDPVLYVTELESFFKNKK